VPLKWPFSRKGLARLWRQFCDLLKYRRKPFLRQDRNIRPPHKQAIRSRGGEGGLWRLKQVLPGFVL